MAELPPLKPRLLARRLRESLREFPVVLLVGARQVGKSTLARSLVSKNWNARYVTLDELSALDAARTDPDGFVGGLPLPVILDEIQRVPDLMRAVKLRVDREPGPGLFLLTGSANVLTMTRVSETLAGRVAVHELHPFAWAEACGVGSSAILRGLFEVEGAADALSRWPLRGSADALEDVKSSVVLGGYPRPVLMKSAVGRRTWFDSYRKTYVERDLRELSQLAHLPEFSRLLTLLSLRTGDIVNVAEVSRSTTIAATTLRRDMNLLQSTFQIRLLAPYAANVGRALFRTPKLYVTDTGQACHVGALESWKDIERQGRIGPLLETWVENQLTRLISATEDRVSLWYFRTRAGHEVDFLLERAGEVVGIEVKWSSSLASKHRLGLNMARELLGSRWRLGILLYSGREVIALDEYTVALPLDLLLRGSEELTA